LVLGNLVCALRTLGETWAVKMKFLPSMVILLLLVSAGCAGPHRAVLPPFGDEPDRVPAGYRVLRTGDYVRIETKPGSVMLGEVKEVSPSHVVLERVGNFGYVELSIQADEILTIELNGGETAGSATKKIGSILVLTVAVFAILFAAFGSVGGN
jgi:hypothetical protein